MSGLTGWDEDDPKGGGGTSDPNVMGLKESNKIRLLQPGRVGWRQHSVESPSDPDQFESIVCPRGLDSRGDGDCPLCRKPTKEDGSQRFKVSKRYATNVWDYESSSVKVLIAGPQVFDEFKATAAVGIDPTSADFLIHKMGQKLNTSYKLVRGDSSPLPTEVTEEMLLDLDKYMTPESTERIFEKLERLGIDYDALPVPSYTVDEALAIQVPFGKHKNMTIEQILAVDGEYLEWLHDTRLEAGQFGDGLFIALHAVLLDRGLAEEIPELPTAPPKPAASAAQSAPPAQAAKPSTAAVSEATTLVGPDGAEMEVPNTAVDAMLSAGFTRKPDPEPVAEAASTEPDDDADVAVDISGTIASMKYKDAKALIASGVATLVTSATAKAPAGPVEPANDDKVQFKPKGMPVAIAMEWHNAKRLFAEGLGEFEGNEFQTDAELKGLAAAAVDRADDKAVAAEVAEAAKSDPGAPAGSATKTPEANTTFENEDGTFSHPDLEGGTKTYKTKGAVTQALKRAGKAPAAPAEVAPAAAAANGNGGTSKDAALERCKQLLSQAPQIQNDFKKLLAIFQEVAGKRNITDFDEDELNKLEERLKAETA